MEDYLVKYILLLAVGDLVILILAVPPMLDECPSEVDNWSLLRLL